MIFMNKGKVKFTENPSRRASVADGDKDEDL